LFDQQTCPLHGALGFRRRKPFDIDKWRYKRNLKLDLFSTQRWSGRQGRNLAKRAGELRGSLYERRALHRPQSCFTPQPSGLLDLARFRVVTRQQLRLVLDDLGELGLKRFGDTGMKYTSRLAQQRPVGRVLHQGVLEQVSRMRRHALPEQQS